MNNHGTDFDPIYFVISCCALLFAIIPKLHAQTTLFESSIYAVTGESVTQGPYRAIAKSPNEIESTYQSDYEFRTPRRIEIKFSINGFDNEAPAGENHTLVIDAKAGEFTSPIFVFGKIDKSVELPPRRAKHHT